MSKVKHARRKIQLFADYQQTFSSPHGKRVLQDMMRQHHMMGSTFDVHHNEMCLREGERNVILRILYQLKMDTNTLLQNLAQAEKEVQEDDN